MALQAVAQVAIIEECETMVALVRIKHQYGQQVVEPVNDIAVEFTRVAGTKLLTQQTIDSMKRLGYRVEVEQTLPRTL